MAEEKTIFKDDCIYFACLICHAEIVDYHCLVSREENLGCGGILIISCGKDCPFYKKKEERDNGFA